MSDISRSNLPKISVITPCLNAGKTIERTLRSIEAQAYANLELIVVDGLSNDRTLEIVQQLSHIVSKIISEKDQGVANAINKGFRFATGELHCYLNADDCFMPGTLQRIAEVFLTHPEIDVITGGCQRVYADGTIAITQVPNRFERLMSLRNDLEQPSTFWRGSIHRKAGELDESYLLAFDWEWWNRFRSCGARFMVIEDVLSVYYFTYDNLTSKSGVQNINEMRRITKQYGPYCGSLAYIYSFLFHFFDMNGYYDQPFDQLSPKKQLLFGLTLNLLFAVFGRDAINSYNWNWASKQIRGINWYK
jgi:glycosyltransferase involved in cell wall biosynthesis